MTPPFYICPHCRHSGSGWIETGGLVFCPKCYRGSTREQAAVKGRPTTADVPDILKEMFGLR